ncbi:hypothetical protein MHU86_20363 [Fragilaria crotonensis]|nr:hypothetical protein MHU86_20363 [Fragilaria crotonensis]
MSLDTHDRANTLSRAELDARYASRRTQNVFQRIVHSSGCLQSSSSPSACHDDFMTSIVDIVRGILDTGFKQDFCLYKLGSPANNTGRVEKVMAA